MASLKRRRPEQWTVTLFYIPPTTHEYDTPLAALGMAGRVSGRGVRASVAGPKGEVIAEFKPRNDPPLKIERDPNLGPNLQAAAEKRRQAEKRERLRRPGPKKKRTLTRRKA